MSTAPDPLVVQPGAGRTIDIGGARLVVLAGAETTGGAVGIVDFTVPPGAPGPPLHRHAFEETFYVLDGTATFELADGCQTVSAGGLVHVPADAAHTFRNEGAGSLRILVSVIPGGFESFFVEAADALAAQPGPPDPSVMAGLWDKYGVIPVAPPA